MSPEIRGSRICAFLALLATSRPATAATTLISCSPIGSGTAPISHAFYIPNYPGVSLRDLTMGVSSDLAETLVYTLTAHADTFDGPVLGSATREIALAGSAANPVAVTFSFGGPSGLPAAKGHTIAFVVNRQGTTFSYQSDGVLGNLFFSNGAAGGCGAVETNDSAAPLSTVKGSVPVTVTGDAVPASLIPNSTFDTGVIGWSLSPLSTATGTFTFSPDDATGSPTSGSAFLTNTSRGLFAVQACVQNVVAGAYTFGGKTRFSAAGGSEASLIVAASSAPDCSDLAGIKYVGWAGDGTWHSTSARLIVPEETGPNTKSLALLLSIYGDYLGTQVKAQFDDVFIRSAPLSALTVLGAASIHGKAGAYFHTDFWILNRSYTNSIDVTPRFLCFGGTGCGVPVVSTLSLAPREQRLYSDAINTLFFAPERAGTIELTWDSSLGSVSAWARTYSPTAPAPTNGTSIPALEAKDSRARAVFIGLASNGGNLGAGFRSNVGLYNPSPVTAHATLSLFDDSGRPLGTVDRTLSGFEAFQFNDIFAVVGAGGTVASRSTLVMTSDVPIFSFATVIDNQTNDSSFLLPTDDEPPL